MAIEKTIDIDPQYLNIIKNIIHSQLFGKKVWAYGSRVKWNAGQFSDLDLVVFDAEPTAVGNAKETFEESALPFAVSIEIWGDLPCDFQANILKKYAAIQNVAKHEWREVRLESVLEVKYGKDHKKLQDGLVPCYGTGGIMRYVNDELYNEESILIPRKGSLNNIYYINEPFWTVDTLFWTKIDKDKVFSKFLFYQLTLIDFTILNVGSAVPSLTVPVLNEIDISLPPLPEQKAIAEVLSALDDKIDLLHRQNKTLEQMAETLFRQWFVIEAGEDWGEKPLSSVANFLNGLACQKFPPKNEVDKLPVLKIKQLRNGFSDDSDWCTTEVKSKYIIENGDVIFSWSASLMVKIWDGDKCILNQHLFKVTSDDFPKWYYYLWSKHHLAEFVSISSSHATTMGHIKRGDLDDAMVLVPSPEEIELMTDEIQPLIDKQITNSKQIRTLESLRDTLLPKLMSGEVRVNFKEAVQ